MLTFAADWYIIKTNGENFFKRGVRIISMKQIGMLCTALVLAVIVSTAFFACDKANDSGGEPVSGTDAGEQAPVDEEQISDDLADADYNGKIFTFITGGSEFWTPLDRICVEGEIGETINDAIYKRTLAVEERFNVRIEDVQVNYSAVVGNVRNSVKSGDGSYDAAYMWGNYFLDLAADGNLHDLNTVSKIDFSKPYWDQSAKGQLSIAGRLYTMTGEANMHYNDSTWVLMFNKQLLQDLQIDDPYQLVRDGKWTIDKMFEMGKQCVRDLDSDGKYTIEDQFGIVTHSEHIKGLFFGSGEKLFEKDSGDIPEFNGLSERAVNVLQKVFDVFNKDDVTFDVRNPKHASAVSGLTDAIRTMYESDKGLFCGEVLECVRRFREMETNFGLLPMPKFDEAQKNYYNYVTFPFSGVCIPIDIDDIDFVGTILESMQSASHYTLVPAYYESALYGKFMRDEESWEMLNIILANRLYPFSELKDFGSLMTNLRQTIVSGKPDFTSITDKAASKAKSEIENLIKKIENN